MRERAGIKTVGHFILGLPGETEESLEETIVFAGKLKLDLAQFYCAVPFPGSRLYERALKEGWINPPDFSNFNQNTPLLNLPATARRGGKPLSRPCLPAILYKSRERGQGAAPGQLDGHRRPFPVHGRICPMDAKSLIELPGQFAGG